jgi:hypothetical protein
MNPKVYNASLLIGVGMGALVIGLTLFGAWVARQ